MIKKKIVEISICMGSSCYPRGNRDTLKMLKDYIIDNNLEEQILLKGNLCEGLCKDGPNIRINGVIYHDIDYSSILELLKKMLEEDDNES